MKKSVVLKVGGSILYDKFLAINYELLDKVRNWYLEAKGEYERIVLVVGGGALSRDMQNRIKEGMEEKYLHNIGMSVTQTNASLLQGFLGDSQLYLPSTLGDAFEYLVDSSTKHLVSGGLKSGWSTDMDAAIFADIVSSEKVLKLSDIEYICDKDPKLNEDAKPIKDMTWYEYFDLFHIAEGSQQNANGKIPIDVGCAQFCKNKDISFFIAGGANMYEKDTVQEVLKNGTLIHS